jgi:hypothetical protein
LPGFDDCPNAVGDSNAILVVRFNQSDFGIGGFDDARRFAGKTEIYIGQLVERGGSIGGVGCLHLDASDIYGGDVC